MLYKIAPVDDKAAFWCLLNAAQEHDNPKPHMVKNAPAGTIKFNITT